MTDPVSTERKRHLLVVEAAYRQWTLDRSDVERLRRLQAAIGVSATSRR